VWVAVARSRDDLLDLAADPRWSPLSGVDRGGEAWSDDYSDVLSALRH
jgi:hypothetical protein